MGMTHVNLSRENDTQPIYTITNRIHVYLFKQQPMYDQTMPPSRSVMPVYGAQHDSIESNRHHEGHNSNILHHKALLHIHVVSAPTESVRCHLWYQ